MPPNQVRTMLETSNGGVGVQSAIGRDLLRELVKSMGHEPDLIPVAELELIAGRLAEMAHGKAWGWRYLRNVMNGKLNASRALVDAINKIGALIDGARIEQVQAIPVRVLALGNVHPDALILADSRSCAYPPCGLHFVPRSGNQKCHSMECSRKLRKLERK